MNAIMKMMITFMLAISGHVVVGQEEEEEAVRDFRQGRIKANTSYYLLSGMNFTALSKEVNICPEIVKLSKDIPTEFMFVSTSDVITLKTKFSIKTVNPKQCPSGTRYWKAELDKPVILDGTESSIESTFSFKKSEPVFGRPAYSLTSGIGDFQGVIDGIHPTKLLGLPAPSTKLKLQRLSNNTINFTIIPFTFFQTK